MAPIVVSHRTIFQVSSRKLLHGKQLQRNIFVGRGGGGGYGFRRSNNNDDEEIEVLKDAIFIQNLPKNITRDDIQDAFSTVGPIKVI